MSAYERELLYLVLLALGLLVAGYGAGLMTYHYGLGWFLSFYRKHTVDHVVASAERHLERRFRNRQQRQATIERRRRIMAAEEDAAVEPRHLAE